MEPYAICFCVLAVIFFIGMVAKRRRWMEEGGGALAFFVAFTVVCLVIWGWGTLEALLGAYGRVL